MKNRHLTSSRDVSVCKVLCWNSCLELSQLLTISEFYRTLWRKRCHIAFCLSSRSSREARASLEQGVHSPHFPLDHLRLLHARQKGKVVSLWNAVVPGLLYGYLGASGVLPEEEVRNRGWLFPTFPLRVPSWQAGREKWSLGQAWSGIFGSWCQIQEGWESKKGLVWES